MNNIIFQKTFVGLSQGCPSTWYYGLVIFDFYSFFFGCMEDVVHQGDTKDYTWYGTGTCTLYDKKGLVRPCSLDAS